jgi:hypothetical protein
MVSIFLEVRGSRMGDTDLEFRINIESSLVFVLLSYIATRANYSSQNSTGWGHNLNNGRRYVPVIWFEVQLLLP